MQSTLIMIEAAFEFALYAGAAIGVIVLAIKGPEWVTNPERPWMRGNRRNKW